MTVEMIICGAFIGVLLVATWLDCRRDARVVKRERFFASRRTWRRALEDGNWRRPDVR